MVDVNILCCDLADLEEAIKLIQFDEILGNVDIAKSKGTNTKEFTLFHIDDAFLILPIKLHKTIEDGVVEEKILIQSRIVHNMLRNFNVFLHAFSNLVDTNIFHWNLANLMKAIELLQNDVIILDNVNIAKSKGTEI